MELKDKSPSFQWYPKQYLGDDKVLAMDWDAKGMHHWLLNLSWQQEPVGSIPDDICLVRRWLGLPSGSADADRVWARVWPQIKAAWALKNGRWFNAGMVRAWERQQTYKQNGSKRRAKGELPLEDEEEAVKQKLKKQKPFTGDDLVFEVLRQIGTSARNTDLTVVVADSLNLKAKEPEWTIEKAATHFIDRGLAYKASPVWNSRYKVSWVKWFQNQCYDQDPRAWEAEVKNGQGRSKLGRNLELLEELD